ncbi:MAG: hypothetical protein JNK54_09510 [Elusimicrobia bacterium]|nr:hypothetical protein [Elusimicrobiota bacterium]
MAIHRWEMLLSAQADSFLLKIQGDRTDVDSIVRAHPQTCQNVQEISDDVFQWAIFVVDAPLPEKLAIQNQVMSLTKDTSGIGPSGELMGILDGLSGALQDLTNLTEDEQTFVMNKMARMGNPVTPTPIPPAKPDTTPPTLSEQTPPTQKNTAPATTPLPRVTIPGQVSIAPPSLSKSFPGPTVGTPPNSKAPTPLPSTGPLPNILRPVQPPKPGNVPAGNTPLPHPMGGNTPRLPNPMPQISQPKISLPPSVSLKRNEPSTPPHVPSPPAQGVPPGPKDKNAPVGPQGSATPIPIPMTGEGFQAASSPPIPPKASQGPVTPPSSLLDKTVSFTEGREALQKPTTDAPLPPAAVEPLAFTPPPAIPTETAPLAEEPIKPPPSSSVSIPATAMKQEEPSTLRVSIFYSTGRETARDRFMTTLTEMAQKKSRKPTNFVINASIATTITLDNSAEWIWKAKTSGSDIFFVVLPSGLGSDLMDPLVGEAQAAGLRCFLIPEGEINSKLLYMDLMVELMMFKRRIRPAS